uniref:Phytochrome kinase substrate 1 n=1 Tax=Kalanchoe fedtschenkoi TaxID=63787 RepID=A0A7N0UDY9_KALFE
MLSQKLSLERGGNGVAPDKGLQDPTFSSYLTAEQSDDGEIGVFGAERYFSESLDEEKPKAGRKCVKFPNLDDPVEPKARSRASSLSSSRNSQSALLQRHGGNPAALNGGSKLAWRGRGYLGSFRCRCICYDNNSVAVDQHETFGEGPNLTQSAMKEAVKQVFSPVAAAGPCRLRKSVQDLPLRKSLEVFGSQVLARASKPFSFDTERTPATNREGGLPFPKPAEIVIPRVVHGACAESDSDASSDLFEIEDFTRKSNPFLSRNLSGSTTTPTAGYAPSEASIDWSVVTASAADFPITSDHQELKTGKNAANRKKNSTADNKKVNAAIHDKPRRLSSSFLLCNSQDSVKTVKPCSYNL